MNSPNKTSFHTQNIVSDNRLLGLWRMMAGYRLTYLGAALCLGLAALSKTATYLLLRYFIDDVLVQETSLIPLPVIAAGFVGLAVLQGGFTFWSGRLAAQTAEGIARRLRNYLFDHIQRLSFTYHDRTPTGELLQRTTSDVDALRRFFADQAIGIGRIILLFAINLAAILSLNERLAVYSIVVIPIIVGVSVIFFKRMATAYEASQNQEASLSTVLQENLSGIRVVKAFARQDFERERFHQANWEKFQRGRQLVKMHALFWPTSDILCAGQMLFSFLMAALMAIRGEISVGTYLAYHGMVIWLIRPMRNLGRLIVQLSTGLVSYGRVAEIIREEQGPLSAGAWQPDGDVWSEIVFEDVCFEYEPGVPVLKDISFSCQPGEVIALMGPTGSGKTSLVQLLLRFYEVTAGTIWLDGRPLQDYPRQYLRRQIGIVEQEPFLFSRTIRENITYGVDWDVPDEAIEAAARAAAIHDVILSFPDGYDTLVGERGVTLSGGQKQRIAIARTLLKDPRILILDDAMSSVDTETEALIREALERLMRGRTTFLIAHRIQSVMIADQILILDKGRIVQHGTHETLVDQPGIYQDIYTLQTHIEIEMEKELARVGLQV